MGTIEVTGARARARWVRAHEALSRLAKKRAELDGEEGRALLAALRAEVHRHLGYASFAEYVERLLGYSYRATAEKLRVAGALEQLPMLDRALFEGQLHWSTARELTRVATVETEAEWLEAARGLSGRQVEALVTGRAKGDRPTDPADPDLRRHVVRFEVTASTLATFREALKALRQRTDEPLDDDATLLLLAREVLGGPSDAGRASYQIAITTCEACGRAQQHAKGELVELSAEELEVARCDAQEIELPDGAHSHAHVGTGHASGARAHQNTPPSVRREVMLRDHGTCVVPGCRHATFVDVHHIELRSEGGAEVTDNLVVLCGAHHQAVHAGRLRIEGKVSSGLRFTHADGTPYGWAAGDAASLVDASERAFRALRRLGFPEKDARAALARVIERGSNAHVGTEQLLRQALDLLVPR